LWVMFRRRIHHLFFGDHICRFDFFGRRFVDLAAGRLSGAAEHKAIAGNGPKVGWQVVTAPDLTRPLQRPSRRTAASSVYRFDRTPPEGRTYLGPPGRRPIQDELPWVISMIFNTGSCAREIAGAASGGNCVANRVVHHRLTAGRAHKRPWLSARQNRLAARPVFGLARG